jgi:uncharacterized membrane protein
MADVDVPGEQDNRTADTEKDARLAFIYQEALRGLSHQQGVVESMNSRAGSLIFATSFASSLLGGSALSDGLGAWDWLAIALLFAIGVLIAFMLWPYHSYTFRFDPEELLEQYADGNAPTAMSEMHRALALRIKRDMADNWRIIQRLRLALQLALILLLFEILAWLLSIGQFGLTA